MWLRTLVADTTAIPLLLLPIVLLLLVVYTFKRLSSRVRTTPLAGPPSKNFFVGSFTELTGEVDPTTFFEKAAKEYGPVYSIPAGLGYRSVVLCDVKAAAHVMARDCYGYHQPTFTRVFMDNMFGRGILSEEGHHHRRIRKALTPAFSNAAIRRYVNVFHENNHKAAWDSLLEGGAETIEVTQWMKNISLENLGVAGFSHQFDALGGKRPDIIKQFETFQLPTKSSVLSKIAFLLSPILPILLKLPTENKLRIQRIRYSMRDIAEELLEKARIELVEPYGKSEAVTDNSIIGLLIKAESASGKVGLTSDEVLAQMNTLFVAGYATTSTVLTWALIELCKHPGTQEKLRQELHNNLQGSGELTWEQLTNGLPYLDAITQETLRLHVPIEQLPRIAQSDDVVPLVQPITDASGALISEVKIAKGQSLHIPLSYINLSDKLWGPDARVFKPERWLQGDFPEGAQVIQGYRHLLTFGDGPRICLGRQFALATFKTTLASLISRYSFELPHGNNTRIEIHAGFVLRPRVAGEKGPRVPMKVVRIN